MNSYLNEKSKLKFLIFRMFNIELGIDNHIIKSVLVEVCSLFIDCHGVLYCLGAILCKKSKLIT